MRDYKSYFTENEIIKTMCSMRLGQAKKIHEQLFYKKIFVDYSQERNSMPKIYSYFPPRKVWHKFRPKKKLRLKVDANFVSLYSAVKVGMKSSKSELWVRNLTDLIEYVQSIAIHEAEHKFSEPHVTPQFKKDNEYRAISSLSKIEDKVLDSLNAKYLRETLDVTLENSSVAFRGKEKKFLNRDYAIEKIISFRKKNLDTTLYVTECDIRGFYDCIHHTIARNALRKAESILKIRNPEKDIHPTAKRIFNEYLNAYSFSVNIKGSEEKKLKGKYGKQAIYKWPIDSTTVGPHTLSYFHKSPSRAKIGIPQGGAHSCFMSNLVLDLADKEVILSLASSNDESVYLRFCDDIILITKSKESAKQAFEAYVNSLVSLKLPYHKETELKVSGVDFFESSKTKVAFEWDKKSYPWISFLGYQIDFSGKLRIRPSSINKHKEKIKKLHTNICFGLKKNPNKVNHKRILFRYDSKVWAFCSGRVKTYSKHEKPLPMCWCINSAINK